MLITVFLSVFGASSLLSARAQESATETPTEIVTPAPTEDVDEKTAPTGTTTDVFSLPGTCDSQVYYGVLHCKDGAGTQYISVDLNDSHVYFQTVLPLGSDGKECNSVNRGGKDSSSNCPHDPSSPSYPFETMKTMLSRYKSQGAVAAINCQGSGHR